jgi:uncharacterized repeat protein (TIGR03847 family)
MSGRVVFRHNPTSNFIVGTIGEPGNRQFFLQFNSSSGTNTIAIEKEQLIALVERFEELIREIKRKKLSTDNELFATATSLDGELEFPIEEDFRAGIMGITWEPDEERVVLEVQELSDQQEFSDLIQVDTDTSEYEFPPDILQANLRISQIRGFNFLAEKVLSAGRQACPFCGLPINIGGHLCPRANGYKR